MTLPWDQYDLILFDFDDTLVDFAAAERHAIAAVCRLIGRAPGDEALSVFRAINRALWRRHDAGELTRDEVFRRRFEEFFAASGATGDVARANEVFLAGLAGDATLLPAAAELVAHVAQHAVVGIVSNGHGPTQRRRLRAAGIDAHVHFFAISDEVGAAKPHPAIFAEAYRMSGLPAGKRTLMVGDNLTADIGGALAAGFDACWVRHGQAEATDLAPTYVFATLADSWAGAKCRILTS